MLSSLPRYVPAQAVAYCLALHRRYPFVFRIVKPRRTRLGDFRAGPACPPQITVNADLPPHAFLLTYVHEVAHCAVYLTRKQTAKTLRRMGPDRPHGRTWQVQFQQLMAPLLTEAIFPPTVLLPLQRYMARPAATTAAHPALRLALHPPPPQAAHQPGQVRLGQLAEGQVFCFQKKTYVRGKLRRTRVVCKEKQSGRSYAILAGVLVCCPTTP